MILTEEEAKTKRCQESYPAAETISLTGHMECGTAWPPTEWVDTGTSTVRYTAPFNCIGSNCMAWRWSKTHNLGYCGKAGVP